MNISELYEKMNEAIPGSFRCPWDNDGIMCCPEPFREARKALISLDVTEFASETAVSEGYDVIVTHHPMIFRPIKGITDGMHIKLIRAGISVFSFHTRFDAMPGGVNHILASKLGLRIVAEGLSEGVGLICESDCRDFAALTKEVKSRLAAPDVRFAGKNTMCSRIALLGGDCDHSFAEAAYAAGCDTLIAGSIGYNTMIDSARTGMNVIAAGHFHTEFPSRIGLEKIISGIDNGIKTRILSYTDEKVLI